MKRTSSFMVTLALAVSTVVMADVCDRPQWDKTQQKTELVSKPNCCSETATYSGCPKNYNFFGSQWKCAKGRLNQGNCGSCWAFASAGAAADRLCQGKIRPQKSIRLSELDVLCGADIQGDQDLCNGGYEYYGMNYMSSTGALKNQDMQYQWDTWRWWNKGKSKRWYCKKPNGEPFTGTKMKLVRDQTERTGNGKYWNIYMHDGINEGVKKRNIGAVKASIYQYGPLPFSMTLYKDWDYHAQYCFGMVYRRKNGPGTCCYEKLKKRHSDSFCEIYPNNYYCEDKSSQCNLKQGGHAMKIVGWGGEKPDEYWLVENSWGKNWGKGGFFKLAMWNTGFWGNHDFKISLEVSAHRRLWSLHAAASREEGNLELAELWEKSSKTGRNLVALRELEEDNGPLSGSSIDVPTDREDVVKMVAAAIGCNSNVTRGLASTLITGKNFSANPSQDALNLTYTWSDAQSTMECLTHSGLLQFEGVDMDSILHSTSQVVAGHLYRIYVQLKISANATVGGVRLYNAPTEGHKMQIVELEAFEDFQNTTFSLYTFSSRVYEGEAKDFEKSTVPGITASGARSNGMPFGDFLLAVFSLLVGLVCSISMI